MYLFIGYYNQTANIGYKESHKKMYIMDGHLKIIINCKVRENRSNSILLNMKTSPKCAYFWRTGRSGPSGSRFIPWQEELCFISWVACFCQSNLWEEGSILETYLNVDKDVYLVLVMNSNNIGILRKLPTYN